MKENQLRLKDWGVEIDALNGELDIAFMVSCDFNDHSHVAQATVYHAERELLYLRNRALWLSPYADERQFPIIQDLVSVLNRVVHMVHQSHPFTRAQMGGLLIDDLKTAVLLVKRLKNVTSGRETKPIHELRILRGFSWFCSKDNREHIAFTTGDLRKDERQMRKERRSKIFIRCVLLWRVSGTVVPIMWDGSCRLIAALLPIGKFISKIKGM